mgnify:FL=1
MLGDLPGERLDAAVAALTAEGIEASAAPCNVADPDQLEALAETAFTALGRVDLVLNNGA